MYKSGLIFLTAVTSATNLTVCTHEAGYPYYTLEFLTTFLPGVTNLTDG